MKTFNTGVTPTGIALGGKKVFVANNNNYAITGQDSVTVIKHNHITTIYDASFNQPYTITMDCKEKYAYVTNSNGSTITIIHVGSNMVVGTIGGFDGPSGMAIYNNTGYVINYGGPIAGSGNGTTVSVVDLKLRTITSTITVALAPAAIKISKKKVYVVSYVDGNPGTGIITVIDTKTNTPINSATGFSGPFDIAVSSCGKIGYVTNFGSNNFAPFGTTISVVKLKSLTIIKTIQTGIQPSGICISPCDNYIYVTNYNTLYAGSSFTNLTPGQGTVTVINTNNYKVLYNIEVNQGPANIVCTDKYLYITNFISNTLNIITL